MGLTEWEDRDEEAINILDCLNFRSDEKTLHIRKRKPEPSSVLPVLTAQSLKLEVVMLGWALTFLVVALIAAFLGFSGVAAASAGIAKILFVVFLVLFVAAMVFRALRGRSPV